MNLKSQFNKIASDYDSQRTKLIPYFDEFYGIAIESVELDKNDINVLDLGAGTGLLSKLFLEKYSDSKLCLVDISENMLNVAKERFSSNANVKFVLEDICNFEAEESYDAIISSLAIHHLKDKDKKQLYSNVFDWLKPNGIFVNAEQIAGETKFLNDMYEKWLYKTIKSSNLLDEEIEVAYERTKLDIIAPISTQLNWLKEAGFVETDCLFKAYCFGVLWAKKSLIEYY